MGLEAGPGQDVDHGAVGEEVVGTEGFALGPEEESEGKVGIVFKAEGNLRKFVGVEAIGVERMEVVPPGLGAELGEDRNNG